MNDSPHSVTAVTQLGVAWGGVWLTHVLQLFGIFSWADFSAMIVSLYTIVMLILLVWKLFHKKRGRRDWYDNDSAD